MANCINITHTDMVNALYNRGAQDISHAAHFVKRGALKIGDETSQVLRDFYSIDGVEKVVSLGIAIFNYLGKSNPMLQTFKSIKSLIFAIKIVNVPANYFQRSPANPNITIVKAPVVKNFDEPVYQPRRALPASTRKDFLKICMDIANFFETCKFLQVNNIYSFPPCQRLATQIGNFKIFGAAVKNIPVLQAVCDKPKEIFVVVGSSFSLAMRIRALFVNDFANVQVAPLPTGHQPPIVYIKNKAWSINNFLGIASDLGRLSLVLLSRTTYVNQRIFTYIELATRIAAVTKFILDQRLLRYERREGYA